MSELPKISVLMPAYNEGDHIRANVEKVKATLEDMLSSSCKDAAGSFEIIVINDGSTDNTKKEIETPKETVWRKKKHRTTESNINQLSTATQSNIIMMASSGTCSAKHSNAGIPDTCF